MYTSGFFAVLVIASLASLVGVYAFQVGAFIKDHKDSKTAGNLPVEEGEK
ncbi:MAG: hypothetical protein KH423_03130 [Actinomycetaceae bacterium]|nr:hypothetical protein [Actinomycetaceae bacterium]